VTFIAIAIAGAVDRTSIAARTVVRNLIGPAADPISSRGQLRVRNSIGDWSGGPILAAPLKDAATLTIARTAFPISIAIATAGPSNVGAMTAIASSAAATTTVTAAQVTMTAADRSDGSANPANRVAGTEAISGKVRSGFSA
jgi:hypothetical protein